MDQIRNNKEEVPFSYYLERFRALDPAETAARLNIPFDREAFTLTLLARTYRISYPDYAIFCDTADAPALKKLSAQTFLLSYLLEGQYLPDAGSWKTFREMPWGEVYVQPFTGRCLNRCAFTFGGKLPAFCRACEALGGKKISHADAGYEIPLIGPYRMRVMIWDGDDEFPPSAQILYSDNFALGFTAEDRVVAGDLLLGALCQAMYG